MGILWATVLSSPFFASFHVVYLILKRFLLPQRGCRWTGHLPLLQNLMEMNMVLVYIMTLARRPKPCRNDCDSISFVFGLCHSEATGTNI